jgi:hypothetical protein
MFTLFAPSKNASQRPVKTYVHVVFDPPEKTRDLLRTLLRPQKRLPQGHLPRAANTMTHLITLSRRNRERFCRVFQGAVPPKIGQGRQLTRARKPLAPMEPELVTLT